MHGRIGRSRSSGLSITRRLRYLQDQEGFIAQVKMERERTPPCRRRRSSRPISPDEIEAHFDYMPDNYFRTFSAGRNRRAPRIFFGRSGATFTCATNPPTRPALRWEALPEQGHSVVSICHLGSATPPRQHRRARLPSPRVNIMSADIFIRGDNLALDVFRVRNEKLGPVTDPQRNRHRRINSASRPPGRTFRFRIRCSRSVRQKTALSAADRKLISRPASASKTRAIPPAP